jgi:hypothetical protein
VNELAGTFHGFPIWVDPDVPEGWLIPMCKCPDCGEHYFPAADHACEETP